MLESCLIDNLKTFKIHTSLHIDEMQKLVFVQKEIPGQLVDLLYKNVTYQKMRNVQQFYVLPKIFYN